MGKCDGNRVAVQLIAFYSAFYTSVTYYMLIGYQVDKNLKKSQQPGSDTFLSSIEK